MKRVIFAIVCVCISHVEAGDLTSPNGQYKIEYDAEALEHESNVELKNAKTGKVLLQTSSYGYYKEKYHEIAWSPDSQYLAVVSRGTRTSIDVEVFRFKDDTVEQITLPSPKLGDGSWQGGRSYFVKHIKWEATTLKYYCYGDKVYGAGDAESVPDNWYHFDIALGFGGLGEEAAPKVISVTATTPKWRGEQAGTGQPATRPESKSEGRDKPQPESEGRSR